MSKIETVLVTGKTHTTASANDGAGGHGRLDLTLTTPGNAASPEYRYAAVQPHPTAEQLFAGAWSSCFIAAIGLVAAERKVKLPADLAVEIEVDLGKTGDAYFLQARLHVSAPGVPHEVAHSIVHAADQICPYSKATRGNIDVAITVA